jgi:ABC-2 type transport system ATP-binding protein
VERRGVSVSVDVTPERRSLGPLGGDAPVAVSGLSKRYRGGVHALRGVDLQVMPGEITALLGPNGAGKTTLLKILLGFEKPSAGRAAVYGLDPWRHRTESLANVGYVPQGTALYHGLSVADHLRLAQFHRPTLDLNQAKARLDTIGISGRSQAGKLSGGQQAQLLLAIALATHARLLLLDEPLASLDPLARREFLQAIRTAAAVDGATVILTSHIVSDIEEICTALAVIGDGQVRIHEPIATALTRHRLTDGHQDVPDATRVGSFSGSSGQALGLWRLNDEPPSETTPPDPQQPGRAPGLEDVVLGYLSASAVPSEGPAS